MVLETNTSYLPLIRTPLVRPGEEEHRHSHESDRASENDKAEQGPTSDSDEDALKTTNDKETPRFRRFEQATNIELFYDLFFVANLAAFTYVHEVNDAATLQQYVGFFCIIWFTWYQVSLYDVRFAMDSAFERVCKAIQFMVMIGFAIVGPRFNPGETRIEGEDDGPNLRYFRALTLILCVSRFILVIQYLQAMWFAREYKKIVVPMLVISGVYLLTSMIYLALYWSFNLDSDGQNHSYIGWYVVAVVETIFATAVSIVWRNLSFVGTHLVERMSLLTLIILGEGAIAIAKAVQYITVSDGVFTLLGPVPAMIVCAVLNLYFMYMIYMDWIHEGLFGTVRQQIWSFLHFPLHVCLVLAVEGASQSITWNAGVQAARQLVHKIEYWENELWLGANSTANSTMFRLAAADLNATAIHLIDTQIAESSDYTSTLTGIGNLLQLNVSAIPALQNGSADPHTAGNALWWLTGTLFETIFKIAGFKSPSSGSKNYRDSLLSFASPLNFTDPATNYEKAAWYQIDKSYQVYSLTYIYFFISTGLFVVLCTILVALNRGRKTQLWWARLAVTAVIGVALTLVATVAATDRLVDFVESNWILPTITLALFMIVVLNSVKLPPPKHSKRFSRG